ncbi:hypothetical protein Dd703_2552 [Musicola paradisiaca Ech703]|uniref:Uncharacterized protein n=1 Tax=Musicola paradisiaca (strain Ech703) TaxID=579405 RepID=C6C9Q7_MUSP7|nr:hypothetical protein Dd703_2552 [Musicola paradisiaca Ech703]
MKVGGLLFLSAECIFLANRNIKCMRNACKSGNNRMQIFFLLILYKISAIIILYL